MNRPPLDPYRFRLLALGSGGGLVAKKDTMTTKPNCADCGTTTSAWVSLVRGLCNRCYHRHSHANTLDRYPRRLWRAEDLVREADWLLANTPGLTVTAAATRLGVHPDSIGKARLRIQRRGHDA